MKFKKIIAGIISGICLISGSVFPVTVNAETALGYIPTGKSAGFIGASLELTQKTITVNEAANAQMITLSAKSTNGTKFDRTGVHITYDEGLELVPITIKGKGVVVAKNMLLYGTYKAVTDGDNAIFLTFANDETFSAVADGTALWQFQLKVKNPKVGDKYPIQIAYVDGDQFDLSGSADTEKIRDYAFSNVEQGYIAIVASTTTTITKTTPQPITTTTTVAYKLGDLNNDSKINAVDASETLSEYARTSTNKVSEFTEAQKKAADVNKDGKINAVDASNILSYYAYTSTSGTMGFETYLLNPPVTTTKPVTTTITTTKVYTTTRKPTTTTSSNTPLKLDVQSISLSNGTQYAIPIKRSDVTFKSNNTDVAVVSPTGVVTAIGVGNAIISVIDRNYNVVQLYVSVTEAPKRAPINSTKTSAIEKYEKEQPKRTALSLYPVINYFIASSTATAQATVAPTIGLLPMPMSPIIST